ncbi:MAG: protein-(glutamine-N5) methyltransferase, release factor-specific [Caulobacterales bacterium 32-69-10]|nr:MAG: protein-(glutamine-N5) methyltransferase, release factor-specific [Caulobacterales bacterium 32-69-10]
MSLTLLQAWTGARDRLKAARIDSPVIDSRLLVEAATGASRLEIATDPYRVVTGEQQAVLDGYVARRERREPVARILGRKGFWKIMLNVSPAVLTPRPDTETILDVVLPAFEEHRRFQLLDLGVGSGAILLAILAERPGATGLGTDISEDAIAVARDNAASLGLEGRAAFLHGDWTHGMADDSFDLVVSNPPYIAQAVIETLDPEVRDHDPRLALDGGEDGLDHYRTLAPEILRVLRPGGLFAVEIGYDQAEAVTALFEAAGADALRTVKDLSTRDRVIAGLKKPLGNPAPTR